MAALAVAGIGAAIGSAAISGTILGLSGATIGLTAGSIIGNALFPTKLPDVNNQGPRFGDLRVQTSAYGNMIPIVAGTFKLSGNIIWARDIVEVVREEEEEVGGKGGGGSQTVTNTTYTYFADFAILLCEGEIAGIRKIWVNGELVFNISEGASTSTIAASVVGARAMRVYVGDETQTADSFIAATEGAANTPGYRGVAYLVIEAMNVTKYGARIPLMEFEVVKAGTSTLPAVTAGPPWGTVAALGTVVFGLGAMGRNGQVFLGTTSTGNNRILRVDFYANAIASAYPYGSGIAGTRVVGLHEDGHGITVSNLIGHNEIFFIKLNGEVSRYVATSAPDSQVGVNYMYAEDDLTLWGLGSQSAGSGAIYRIKLFPAEGLGGTFTAIRVASSTALSTFAIWAARTEGRIYAQEISPQYIGYIDTKNLVWVRLYNPGFLLGILQPLYARDGSLWIRNSAISTQTTNLLRIDGNTGAVLSSITVPEAAEWRMHQDYSHLVWVWAPGKPVYVYHPTTLTLIRKTQPMGANSFLVGFTEDNQPVVVGTDGVNYYFEAIDQLGKLLPAPASLSDFVSDFCARVGIGPSDIDVSELTDEISGYSISRRDSVRSGLAPLQVAFGFDALESDNQIVFRKRGRSVAATIPLADLSARISGSEAPPPVSNVRKLETELPREVAVQYYDVDTSYEMGSQYDRRLVGSSVDPVTLDLPIVMTSQKAAQIAQLVLYERWAARNEQEISVPRKYADLEPTDVIVVDTDSASLQLRIVEKTETGGLIKLKTVSEDVNVYDTTASGVSGPDTVTTVPEAGPTNLMILG